MNKSEKKRRWLGLFLMLAFNGFVVIILAATIVDRKDGEASMIEEVPAFCKSDIFFIEKRGELYPLTDLKSEMDQGSICCIEGEDTLRYYGEEPDVWLRSAIFEEGEDNKKHLHIDDDNLSFKVPTKEAGKDYRVVDLSEIEPDNYYVINDAEVFELK